MHGSGEAQVVISDAEILALLSIAIHNLNWSFPALNITEFKTPNKNYYEIPLAWFHAQENTITEPNLVLDALSKCFDKNNDFALYIENLSALHRRRVKYQRILSTQQLPTMDQIGPRALLEFGNSETTLLANWMLWRKWIYDIDNRSAQETGYLFEPLLASCIGGAPVSASHSPVKRLDSNGNPSNKGRQIDCLVPTNNRTYELKLRVTIAASGQGRFNEEMSFPVESQAAGFIPVLLVLDPTHSNRLEELSTKYIECGGQFYHGEAAWKHMEQEAGDIVSVFIENYIKPAIKGIEAVDISILQSINLHWSEDNITISTPQNDYVIKRK